MDDVKRRIRVLLNLGAIQRTEQTYSLTRLGESFIPSDDTIFEYQQNKTDVYLRESLQEYNKDLDFIELW